MGRALELVIFDCDGVLVDSERIAVRTDVKVLASLGWHLTEEECIERFVGLSDRSVKEAIEAHLGRALPDDWDEAFKSLYHEAFAAELTPVPGVVEALDRITCPVLTISAKDDFYGTSDPAEYIARRVRNGRAILCPTGGHLWVGHEDDVWREIQAFLATVDGNTQRKSASPGV